jgi:hypothetical protein
MEAADVAGIVFMEANQAKRVSLIVETQPRAMVINTIMAKNIPGEQTFIISEAPKAPRGTKPVEGEEVLSSLPILQEANEIIVDNEDPGFSKSKAAEKSPLRRLLGITANESETYSSIREFMMPEYWQPVVLNDYFGKYVKSAVYTKSGAGERSLTWKGVIETAGYYDVYASIPKSAMRMGMARQVSMQRGGGGTNVTVTTTQGGPAGGSGGPGGQAQGTPMMKEFTFTVYHDDGKEEIVIDFETADPGWNKLGSYYLSPDTVMVELNNKSTGRVVVGDAIKWVKRND